MIDTSLGSGADCLGPSAEVRLDPDIEYLVNPRSTVVLFGK